VLLPLVGDSAYTLARRALRGENVLHAHHSHLYQRLLRAGHSHGTISGCYALATLAIALLVTAGGKLVAGLVTLVWAFTVIAAERYLSSRGVPFTRPPDARLSNSA
jgi:Fuc2NAc and GlcNAc transferase